MTVRLDHLLIGHVVPLGDLGAPSGINEHCLDGRLCLDREGHESEAQSDQRNGGPDKAVCVSRSLFVTA